MTNSERFIKAHRITRETVARFGGCYRVTFAIALSQVCKREKNVNTVEFTNKLRAEIARQRQVIVDIAIDDEDAAELGVEVDEVEKKFNRVIAFVESTGWVEANDAEAKGCFSGSSYEPAPNLCIPFGLAKAAGF